MIYEVDISKRAIEQLDAAYEWLSQESPQHAPEWYNRMADGIASRAEFPLRCPKVSPHGEARYLLVGNKWHAHKINFRVKEQIVYVYSIRHAARSG